MALSLLVAVVGVLLAAMTVNALAASQVKSVRLWRAPDNTRLVTRSSARPAQRLYPDGA